MSEMKINVYLQDPDVQLMLKFQKGDKLAFEELMKSNYKRILNFIYRYTGSVERSQDLTQDVFLKVYNNARSYEPKSKWVTWIFTIARNAALNELRKVKKEAFSLDQNVPSADGDFHIQMADEDTPSPDQGVIVQEKAKAVKLAIAQLPENQRAAVLLRRYEQLSYEEIAQSLGTTQKAVKSLLNRAKENLKINLAEFLKD